MRNFLLRRSRSCNGWNWARSEFAVLAVDLRPLRNDITFSVKSKFDWSVFTGLADWFWRVTNLKSVLSLCLSFKLRMYALTHSQNAFCFAFSLKYWRRAISFLCRLSSLTSAESSCRDTRWAAASRFDCSETGLKLCQRLYGLLRIKTLVWLRWLFKCCLGADFVFSSCSSVFGKVLSPIYTETVHVWRRRLMSI